MARRVAKIHNANDAGSGERRVLPTTMVSEEKRWDHGPRPQQITGTSSSEHGALDPETRPGAEQLGGNPGRRKGVAHEAKELRCGQAEDKPLSRGGDHIVPSATRSRLMRAE